MRAGGGRPTPIGRERFEQQVHGALRCLYDHARLDGHPLAAGLGPPASAAGGRALRRLLLDAIQELKPARDTPRESPDWQHYQYLYLRYVEARPVAEVADDLAVGERQTRRRQRDALAALARLLWPRWRALAAAESAQGSSPGIAGDPPNAAPRSPLRPLSPWERDGVRASQMGVGPPADDHSTAALTAPEPPVDAAALGRELERLDSAEPGGPVDLAELAAAAVATVARLAERAGSAVALRRPAEPLLAVGSPTVLRQAILDGLVCALRRSGPAPISVELAAADGAARLTIRTAAGRASTEEPELTEMRQLLATQGGALDRHLGPDGWSLTLAVPAGQPATVLVVDDSDDIRQLFRRYLSGTSYRVAEARCGDEGLDLVGRLRPACLILDVMMPSRDGWEVLQLLRAQPSTADTPVIVCTVLRQRELALSLGATGYLAKPVARETLLAALRDALDRSGCCPVVTG